MLAAAGVMFVKGRVSDDGDDGFRHYVSRSRVWVLNGAGSAIILIPIKCELRSAKTLLHFLVKTKKERIKKSRQLPSPECTVEQVFLGPRSFAHQRSDSNTAFRLAQSAHSGTTDDIGTFLFNTLVEI